MNFEELNLNVALLNALTDLGIQEPTTIQERVFPVAMAGNDICGIAQTGTGKTFAYLLPILRQHKFSKEKHPQILILVPTRELVLQVEEEARRLSAYMSVRILGVFGGVNITTQLKAVNEGVDLIVATPGRLIDLIYSGSLRMKSIKRLVIDEMDEMLNLGFRTQLKNVLDALPAKRQNLLFSATITEEVEELLDVFFTKPIRIEAAPTGTPLENIAQQKYEIPNFNTKVNLLKLLFEQNSNMTKVLIFTSTKKMADLLYSEMEPMLGETVGVIHSNKDQNNRMKTIQNFHDGTYKAVIATDIVARGIDVASVSHVVCFDIPDVVENYIHRIGRTGRADQQGNSISFVTEKEQPMLASIEEFMKYEIPKCDLPQNLNISDILIEDEIPKVYVKEISMKLPKKENVGPAFHPKSLKNSVHKKPLTFKDKMAMKYKKPKKRKPKK
jgi:ATP-dependent RNA helicase RhlE